MSRPGTIRRMPWWLALPAAGLGGLGLDAATPAIDWWPAALIGAVLAGAASIGIVKFFVQDFLATSVPFTSYITVEQALVVPPILLAVGVVLSAIAAKIAISRYLRV